jgi:hypothetical protein
MSKLTGVILRMTAVSARSPKMNLKSRKVRL